MSKNTTFPPNNGTVFTIDKIIKAVMSLAAEAELVAPFINCKEAITAHQELEEMGHKQPPTPMQTDNRTAHGVITNNISGKKLKSMDKRLHWIRCRSTQRQFRHYRRLVATNLGDYVTKHHEATHNRKFRPIYLTPKIQLDLLRTKTKIKEN